ncbi:DNA-binding transcriptional regulator, MerR family [Seinonella peptonophila]|uniref:DNA-binding transcriptional regulator, MerR family n=1 Tax=Seinonella peptonophila TaxID=112248 RepID=A0A1M5ACE3_9BACL|nr:MerR family transcriptional regulator [Seinonella peptonophila]SHF27970.1 DNA-binding transcriptional regulator, MerR family [Seinonella peptonophila]
MKQNWKIGELARLAGLTVRTLQYYDQIDLFSPSGHSDSGRRIYTESDLIRLQQILSLKELGLSLEEIQTALKGDQISLSDLISLQMNRVKKIVEVNQKLLRELEYIADLMQKKEPLTIENFTKLWSTMRISHEEYMNKRREDLNLYFNRLSDLLEKHTDL